MLVEEIICVIMVAALAVGLSHAAGGTGADVAGKERTIEARSNDRFNRELIEQVKEHRQLVKSDKHDGE
jgi:hypothetical protein